MYFFLELNLIKEIKVHVQEKPILGGEIQTQLKETVFLETGNILTGRQSPGATRFTFWRSQKRGLATDWRLVIFRMQYFEIWQCAHLPIQP